MSAFKRAAITGAVILGLLLVSREAQRHDARDERVRQGLAECATIGGSKYTAGIAQTCIDITLEQR